jgi:hypothetical protein
VNKPAHGCDEDFLTATRQAAIGDYAALTTILLDPSRSIGMAERQRLAELISRDLGRPHGRPSFGPGHPKVVRAVARYRELRNLKREKQAAGECGDEFGVSPSTIRQWNKETKEREAAIAMRGP